MDKSKETVRIGGDGDASSFPPRVSPARFSLLVYHRDGAELVPLVHGAGVIVGRSAPASAVIADASLSRQHARFTLADDGVVVEDLGSTNGTVVGGKPIERAVLRPGDEAVLGAVVATVHVLSEADDVAGGI